MEFTFDPKWEEKIMMRPLVHQTEKLYICSPLSAPTLEGIAENSRNARAYMYYVQEQFRVPAVAPHGFLPMLMDDRIPGDRAAALEFGQKLLKQCSNLLVCGERISKGMLAEIDLADQLNMPIMVFNRNVFLRLVLHFSERNLFLNRHHPILETDQPLKAALQHK